MHRDGPLGMLFHDIHKKNTDFLGQSVYLFGCGKNKYLYFFIMH